MGLLENLKNLIKCDKCKGYLILSPIELEIQNLHCRCGGNLSPIESVYKWIYKGYNCEIKKNNYLGSYMGYIDLDKGHYLYEENFSDINSFGFMVHGGLTYSGMEEGKWRIGFDTAHGFDYIPIFKGTGIDLFANTIWTLEGIKEEVEQLIDQIEGINRCTMS